MILEQMIFKKLLVYKLPASFNPNHILLIQVDEGSVASQYPACFSFSHISTPLVDVSPLFLFKCSPPFQGHLTFLLSL